MGDSKSLLILLCRNDAFSAVMYAGAALAGHAVAFLDARAAMPLTTRLVAEYQPACVAGPVGLADYLVGNGLPVKEVETFDGGELVRMAYPRVHLHRDLAVMLPTSGTTGSRKFVRLSARNLESNARSIGEYLGLTSDERPITSLPFHYSFGLSVLNSHWLAGAAVVVTPETVLQRPFWDAFRSNDCTSMAGVPLTFQMLERVGFRDMDLPSLRTLQQAGGALDRRLTQVYSDYMASRGGRFFVMYGQTEATARIAFVPPDRLPDKLGSAGVPIPGGLLRVDTDHLAEASHEHAAGEVVYEGPNVMMGYASGANDLALGDELGGVLRTGDIGYLDDEGYLFLVGRSKRIAKVFGLRINLDEFEATLQENGPAAVVGGEDAIWAFCAFGTDETVAALAVAVARDLKIHHGALRFRRVAAIPATASGKVDYGQLRQWVVVGTAD